MQTNILLSILKNRLLNSATKKLKSLKYLLREENVSNA